MFVRRNRGPQAVLLLALVAISGCSFYRHERPRVTALPASPANQCEPPGIPFYLPKPLLVISKNFYHVEEATVGLTDSAPIPDSFDAQDKYGSVSLQGSFSRTSSNTPPNNAGADTGTSPDPQSPTLHSPGAPTAPRTSDLPSDGLGPHMFFTYEIVFVPDLSQKYVLQLNGGPGEMRAAMNLVNGWQFTGLGPYYLKDSSTAQNHMARGVAINLGLGGASDVINSIANLKSLAGDGKSVGPGELAALARALERAQTSTEIEAMPEFAWGTRTEFGQEGTPQTVRVPPRIENYAEIYVYEAVLEAGQMLWRPVELQKTTFDREFLGVLRNKSVPPGSAETGAPAGKGPGSSDAGSLQQSGARSNLREQVRAEMQTAFTQGLKELAGTTPATATGGSAGNVRYGPPPVQDGLPVSALGTAAPLPGSPLLDPSLARDIVEETLATPRKAAPPPSRWTDFFHPFRKHRAKSVDTTINSE